MNPLIETLKNFGLARMAILAAVIIGLGGGLHYLTGRVAQPEMALLYANLDLADAGKIVSKIENMGIEADIRGGGTQIFVPSSKVARLRMDLAESGLPRGGSIGYEIFDRDDIIGTSGFVQDINHLRALEGELARTISSLAQVDTARVHLVLPRRELFSRDRQEPSASIMLTLQTPGKLAQSRVQAIQHLVASAVPGLAPERVSIVDDRGTLLARGDNNTDILAAATLDEKRLAYESRLSQTIETLVEKRVGPGKVRAEVSVDMDFDRITENSEEYNPDGQVIRSSQVVEEGENSSEAGGGATSVAGQVPNAGTGATSSGGQSSTNRKEQTLNYEISKKIRTHVKEIGTVKKMNVAVMVDGNYTGKTPAEKKYEPRSKEEMTQLKTLIQNAVGFDEKRGDKVEVLNMQFAEMSTEGSTPESATFLGLSKPDVVRLIEGSIVALISLLVLLMVVKPLVIKILESLQPVAPLPSATETTALVAQAVQAQTNTNEPPAPALPEVPTGPTDIEKMLNIQQIEGQIRESSVKQIAAIVDNKPQEAVAVVREWMQQSR